MNFKEMDLLYDKSPETDRINIKDEFVEFAKHFKYIGSHISCQLSDDYDIEKE